MKTPAGIIIVALILCVVQASAQTRGLIYDPATGSGSMVLDPNQDGYTSLTSGGFVLNDQTESEIPYIAVPVPSSEPSSDLGPGPDCGFTDFVDSGIEDPVLNYLSPSNNWLFRLRMGRTAPNSKGYSILVDADQQFGFIGPNKDPNAVLGNPGFEFEINFQSNFGVFLYDVDGTTSPVLKASYSGHDYYQKSIALSNNCGDPDYFYDFYIPFSAITTAFPSITPITPLRLSIITQMNPNPAIGNNALSDAAGIDDSQCNYNYDCLFQSIVDNYTPCAIGTTCPDRTTCPTINSISAGANAVSGVSSEATGTVIKVFKNSSLIGTTTVTAGSWTLNAIVPSLVSGDVVTATATASMKGESINNCSVTTVGATCSNPPTITCSTAKGLGGNGPSGAAAGTVIRIYSTTNISTPLYTTSTDATNAYIYNCNSGSTCSSGPPGCFPNGNYYVTAQEAGKCESIGSSIVCIGISGGSSTSTVPVITTYPITSSTTTLAGTGVSGASVIILANGSMTSTTTVVGTSWSKSGLSFAKCQSIQAIQIETGKCVSAATSASIVTDVATPPIITGNYCTTTTISTVNGTSSEGAGTSITVYSNAISVGSTTVNSNGTWSLTGLSISPGAILTAKALNNTTCKSLSAASTGVTVISASTATATIATPVIEGTTTLTGTCASGATVKVYMDGALLGTAVTSGTSWTLTGLTIADLYAGGSLYATASTGIGCEGSASSSVTVGCNPPSSSLSVTPSMNSICNGTQAAITINSPQSGVVYQLYNGDPSSGGTFTGTSKLSRGSDITLTSSVLTTSTTFYIKAIKMSLIPCNSTLSNTSAVTVLLNGDPSCGPLPISLLSATAYWDSYPELRWVTIKEGNNTQYILQRSTDNIEYTYLASIPEISGSSGLSNYVYMDNSTTNEKHLFYRLWEGTQDERIMLHTFEIYRKGGDAYIDNSVPEEVTFYFSGSEAGFSISNSCGQVIVPERMIEGDHQPYTISITPGFYMVSFKTTEGLVTRKLVVRGGE